MTSIDFNNFLTFLNDNRIFPPSLVNDPVWQKNTVIFLGTFERFLRTDKGKEYLNNPSEEKITIVEGSTIPVTGNNCPECPRKEDLKPIKNIVKKINPFEQILRGEYRK